VCDSDLGTRLLTHASIISQVRFTFTHVDFDSKLMFQNLATLTSIWRNRAPILGPDLRHLSCKNGP